MSKLLKNLLILHTFLGIAFAEEPHNLDLGPRIRQIISTESDYAARERELFQECGLRSVLLDRPLDAKRQESFFELWWKKGPSFSLPLDEDSDKLRERTEDQMKKCRAAFSFLQKVPIEFTALARAKVPQTGYLIITIQSGDRPAKKTLLLTHYDLSKAEVLGFRAVTSFVGGLDNLLIKPNFFSSKQCTVKSDDMLYCLRNLFIVASLKINHNAPIETGKKAVISTAQSVYGLRLYDEKLELRFCSEGMLAKDKALGGLTDSLDISNAMIGREVDSFLDKVDITKDAPCSDVYKELSFLIDDNNPIITRSDLQWISIFAERSEPTLRDKAKQRIFDRSLSDRIEYPELEQFFEHERQPAPR